MNNFLSPFWIPPPPPEKKRPKRSGFIGVKIHLSCFEYIIAKSGTRISKSKSRFANRKKFPLLLLPTLLPYGLHVSHASHHVSRASHRSSSALLIFSGYQSLGSYGCAWPEELFFPSVMRKKEELWGRDCQSRHSIATFNSNIHSKCLVRTFHSIIQSRNSIRTVDLKIR